MTGRQVIKCRKAKERGKRMKLILKYIRKHLGIFLLSTFFMVVEAMADIFQPAFMSFFVDLLINNAYVS